MALRVDATVREKKLPIAAGRLAAVPLAGLNYGSSHSGRRTLATWLDRKGYDLELIQLILGHRNPDMTLEYIDPDLPRIKAAFQSIWSGVKPAK